jgi:hypothetical protein
MTGDSQNLLFIIIIILLVFVFVLVGVILFLFYKFLLKRPLNSEITTPLPSQYLLKKDFVVEKFYCHNHPDKNSIGSCLICEEVFCESCLIEHDGMFFCKEHFKIFANCEWEQISDVKTTPDTPMDSMYIWDFKRKLWNDEKIPSFVLTHYKINVENDFIESYVQLNVKKELAEKFKIELEKLRPEFSSGLDSKDIEN